MTFPVVEHRTSEKWNCATQHAADINNRTQIVSPTSTSMVSSFRTHRMPVFRPTGDPANAALTWIAGGHDQLTWRKWWSSPSWLRWMTAGWPSTWGAFPLVSGRGSSGVRVGGGGGGEGTWDCGSRRTKNSSFCLLIGWHNQARKPLWWKKLHYL